MKLIVRRILFILVLIFLSIQAIPQAIDDIKISARFNNRPVSELFTFLEQEHNLTIFYKDSWIENITINQQFNNTPLFQALTRSLQDTEIAFEFFQDYALIIIPKNLYDHNQNISDQNLVTIIGDPLNIGRYRNATLTGTIVDGKNGEPLAGAVLYIKKLEKGISTNADGEFEFELPTGEHNIQISFMGYEQSIRRINLIESGSVEFNVFQESLSIEEVTVFAEGFNNSRTQMSLVRIDAKTLKELPVLMGEADVIKSITMMNGVQTVSELASGFNVRGGNTDQNLVLVNNAPVFNTSHLFGFLSMLNPDVIENVTLYKGGLPARYGERVSSVMEVDLKEGNDEAISLYGGLGLINSRLTLEGPVTKNKKFKILLGGRTSYSNWLLEKVPDADITQSITHFYDFSGKTTYNFNLHNKISLMAYSSNDEFNTSSETIIKYGNTLANLMSQNKLGEKLNGELNLAYSAYHSRLTDLANNNTYESYNLDNELKYISGKYHFRWHPDERHNLSFGVNMMRYILNPGEITPDAEKTVIEKQTLQTENALELAGYISDEFQVLPNIIFNAGLRYSHYANLGSKTVYLYDETLPKSPETIIDSVSYGKNEVTQSFGGLEPRLSLSILINDNNSVKMSYQRTRQYIGQISNNAVVSPVETWKLSDYYIQPLISDQVAVGLTNDNLRGLVLNSELYLKKLKNLIEYKNGAEIIMNEHLETVLIPSEGYSYGIEVGLTKTRGRLTGILNYTYSRTMRRTDGDFDEETLNQGSWYPSIYDKPHDLSVSATYHLSRRWRVAGNFVYISGRPVTLPELKYTYGDQTLIYYSDRNKYRIPPYHRLDISMTLDENLKRRRSWKGSWTLSVYNVYGRHNPYSVYYRKGKASAATDYSKYALYKLSVIGVPVPTLTYNFRF